MGELGPQLNADNVRVFGTGHFYLAPYGSTMPTTLTANPASPFLDLGYVTEDAVKLQPELRVTEIYAWQSRNPIRIVESQRLLRLVIPAIEMKDVTWEAYWGGGSWESVDSTTEEFTPPEAGVVTEWAGVFDSIDGDVRYRYLFERIVLTSVQEIAHGKTVPTVMGMTFTVIGDENGSQGWTLLRTKNDPDS